MGTSFLLFGSALFGELYSPAVSAHVYTTLMCVLANFLIIPRNGDFSRLNFFGVVFVMFQGYWYFWMYPGKKSSEVGRLFWTFLLGGLIAVFIDVWNSAYWAVDDPTWVSRRQGAWCVFNFVRGYGGLVTIKEPNKNVAIAAFSVQLVALVISLAATAWSQSVAMVAIGALDVVSSVYAFTGWNGLSAIEV